MLKITKYADRLLKDLDKLDWPDKVKKMQSDWIGRSQGAEINFKVKGTGKKITVFTTRPDTLYGSTFMVMAPEHPMAKDLMTSETKEQVEDYIFKTSLKSSVDRMQDKEKTGVFTGSYAINPINNREIPIYLADYVLPDYGTGAVMCVPAHDDRDFAFAKKYNLPIIPVISKDGKNIDNMEEAYTDAVGTMINSGEWNGMESSVLKKEAPSIIDKKGLGKATVNYKLRDWVFSRQRYWGEPIPIIHCKKCGNVAVPESELPLLLPDVKSYEPTGTGESPLAAIDEWVNCKCPNCNGDAKRETNTMPQWAGSSWYFLRYIDRDNDKEIVSKEKADKYLPVDMYIGGVEHAVLHLLYSRFYTKFLHDIGVISFDEPFIKLFNQGMITGKNGIKMSKSKGNVISPDDLVRDYGCDSLRLYELFVGPPKLDAEWDDRGIDGVRRFYTKFLHDIGVISFDEPFIKLFNQGMITGKNGIKMSKSKGNVISPDDLVRDYGCDSLRLYELFVGPPKLDAEWDDRGIDGVRRFLSRFWNLALNHKDDNVEANEELLKIRNRLIHDITDRLDKFNLNTVVSGFMEYNNALIQYAKDHKIDKETLKAFSILLAPFAPHISEEVYHVLGNKTSVFDEKWPTCNEKYLEDNKVEIALQINGKVKERLFIEKDEDKDKVISKAKKVLKDKLSGNIIKEIYVPNKIVNIVMK